MKTHTPPPEYDKKENAKRLREGLENHIKFVSEKAVKKHGRPVSFETLSRLLGDNEIVRFPTSIIFDDAELSGGEPVKLERLGDGADEKYRIIIHPAFAHRDKDLVALAIYQIVKINYGKIAKEKEALLFASSLLDIEEDLYKEQLNGLLNEIS